MDTEEKFADIPENWRKYFENPEFSGITKWKQYFDVYDRYFPKYQNQKPVVVEVGVKEGGSLQMWRDYFGDGARIIGIDIDPECRRCEGEGIEIMIGSQSDCSFLKSVVASVPSIDIVIDDGGHLMDQQLITFEEMFDAIKDDGLYLCEDTHTSYHLIRGGGHKRRGTFIEFAKNLVDDLHGFHSQQRSFKVNKYTTSIKSIAFYDSLLVIEKTRRQQPEKVRTIQPNKGRKKKGQTVLVYINRVLRYLRLRSFKFGRG